MKQRFIYIFVFFFAFQHSVFAAPTQKELNQLLAELNWTDEDLKSYLDYYELSIEEFESIDELKKQLGTPITNKVIAELLLKMNMTRSELDLLLAEYGETLEDYHFIEDLEIAINFYKKHEEEMAELAEFMTLIGLSNNEMNELFSHFTKIDQDLLEMKMENSILRINTYFTENEDRPLSKTQQKEVITILKDMLTILELDVELLLVDQNGVETAVNGDELMSMEELYGNQLMIKLYSSAGELLLDMQLSEDLLTSDFLIQAVMKFAQIGDLAGELTTNYHNRLPMTATPYWEGMLFGLVAIFLGILGLFIFKGSRSTSD